eukprot:jgi/Mesen1/5272/ME000263S04382
MTALQIGSGGHGSRGSCSGSGGSGGVGAAVEALAGFVRASSSLSALVLPRTALGDAGAEALAGALASSNAPLAKLDLSSCGVATGGGLALCRSLQHVGSLTDLNLSGNLIGPQ